MSGKKFADRTASVLVVDPQDGLRSAMTQYIRNYGFGNVNCVSSLRHAVGILEATPVDWIVTPLFMDDGVNAMHVLRLAVENDSLHETHMSLFLGDDEKDVLDPAFAMGLLSWHLRKDAIGEMTDAMKEFFRRGNAFRWDLSLVAAESLRRWLRSQTRYGEVLRLEQSLVARHPAKVELLLTLAQAQADCGQRDTALLTALNAKAQDVALTEEVDALVAGFVSAGTADDDRGDSGFVYGISKALIVDPDEAASAMVQKSLVALGVEDIRVFSDGEKAWEEICRGDAPDLIVMEWRIPRKSGSAIVQGVRNRGCHNTLIVVHSSLVKAQDRMLLREMGVTDVIEKPCAAAAMNKVLQLSFRHEKVATEGLAMEKQIRRKLASGDGRQAQELMDEFNAMDSVPLTTKHLVAAEMAFKKGDYLRAKDLALQVAQSIGESIELLSLLGRTMIKLQQFDLALTFLERAKKLSPQNIERLCLIAETSLDKGDVKAAESQVIEARKVDPGSERVIETEVKMSLVEGDTKQAKELMAKLTTNRPEIVAFLNNRAVAHVKQGEIGKAMELYKRALKSFPEDATSMLAIVNYNMGLAHARLGELDEASRFLAKAAAVPNSPVRQKARSLQERTVAARDGNEAVALRAETLEEIHTDEVRFEQGALPSSDTLKAGQIGLYGIFHVTGELSALATRLLADPPRFVPRDTITKTTGKKRRK